MRDAVQFLSAGAATRFKAPVGPSPDPRTSA